MFKRHKMIERYFLIEIRINMVRSEYVLIKFGEACHEMIKKSRSINQFCFIRSRIARGAKLAYRKNYKKWDTYAMLLVKSVSTMHWSISAQKWLYNTEIPFQKSLMNVKLALCFDVHNVILSFCEKSTHRPPFLFFDNYHELNFCLIFC